LPNNNGVLLHCMKFIHFSNPVSVLYIHIIFVSVSISVLIIYYTGGGLWHTWFDRDLSVSGRVLVQQKPKDDDGSTSRNTPQSRILKTEQRLINLEDPIARISTLAIHLHTRDEMDAFKVNKENHTSPIIATTTPTPKIRSQSNDAAKNALEKEIDSQVNATTSSTTTSEWQEAQEPLLLKAIADKLEIEVESIVDFELNLYDTQPASLGGITKEFLYSARLDNLATVFVALESLVDYTTGSSEKEEEKNDKSTFEDSSDVSVVVFFDHEEVGSNSAQGAGSPVMVDCISRISTALNGGVTTNPDMHNACIRKSFVLSIDQAHALHPNYASKHEATHAPVINGGVVIKTNSNQRYATNGVTGFVVRELGRICDIPVQEFVVRNDCPCGSTIGPEISAKTGIRVVDAGMPQLSMHSCREMMGIADLSHGVDMFTAFFNHFRSIDDNLSKDIV
jgi:aspartyl aminopeptidase